MKASRLITAFLLMAGIFTGVWFLLLGNDSPTPANARIDDSEIAEHPSHSEIKKPTTPAPIPSVRDKSAEVTPQPEILKPTTESDLHKPNYGPLLQRGSGQVGFELYDANNQRVNLSNESISLRRILGKFAIGDGCHRDDNKIVCGGLSHSNFFTGLEPGDYELTMKSGRWGNMRRTFSVSRGENRTERLQSKHFERVVCFYFVDQNGQPVKWINGKPMVSATSEALPNVVYGTPEQRFLKSRPDKTPSFGGSYWRSSGSRRYERKLSNQRYATDDGRFYAKVWSGAANTVTFKFDKGIWGVEEYKVTDTFIDSRWELHQVALELPEDFNERVMKLGEYGLKSAGNKPVASVSNSSERPEFSPETAPIISGYGRVIITEITPEGLKPKGKWQLPQRQRLYGFKLANGQSYCDFPVGGSIYISAVGRGLTTKWKKVLISDGQITYAQIDSPATTVAIDTSELSPTLNAAALVLELQLNRKNPIVRDEKVVEEPMPLDKGSTWAKAPAGTSFIKRFRFEKTGGQHGYSQYFNPSEPFSGKAFERFGYRTILRTAARHRSRSGSASNHPSGRMYFDPITLKSPWAYLKGDGQTLLQKLQDGDIKPAFDGVFAFRAVGDNREGLPWVQGILMPLEHEELALAVKARMEGTPDGSVPSLDNKVIDEYADELAAMDEVEESESTSALKKLIGEDNYKRFENDEQRLWFANNASWYNSHMKVFSDDHGYILTRQHKLEDGKNYVLYLWSNSRDQMKPDKRIVFKAAKNNTDLGVIRLPSYR